MVTKKVYQGLFFKLALPVVIFSAVAITALGFYIPDQIKQRAINGATTASEQTANQFKVLRKYYVRVIT